MAQSTPFTIGAVANCTDGVCGRVTQVVVDPVHQTVTHLIVEPEHRSGLGRLVPVDLVEPDGDEMALRCSTEEFERLERAEETQFLPGIEGYPDYEAEQMLLWPYFGGNTTPPVTVDTLPVGEVAIRRGDEVHAVGGAIGKVEGLVVDRDTHHVTHILLQEGHLIRHEDVAIPISAVKEVGVDGIRLSITKEEAHDLPPVEFDRR